MSTTIVDDALSRIPGFAQTQQMLADLQRLPIPAVITHDAVAASLADKLARRELDDHRIVHTFCELVIGESAYARAVRWRSDTIAELSHELARLRREEADRSALPFVAEQLASVLEDVAPVLKTLRGIRSAEDAIDKGSATAKAWTALVAAGRKLDGIRSAQKILTADAYQTGGRGPEAAPLAIRDVERYGVVHNIQRFQPFKAELDGTPPRYDAARAGASIHTPPPWPAGGFEQLRWAHEHGAVLWLPSGSQLRAAAENHKRNVADAAEARDPDAAPERRKAARERAEREQTRISAEINAMRGEADARRLHEQQNPGRLPMGFGTVPHSVTA